MKRALLAGLVSLVVPAVLALLLAFGPGFSEQRHHVVLAGLYLLTLVVPPLVISLRGAVARTGGECAVVALAASGGSCTAIVLTYVLSSEVRFEPIWTNGWFPASYPLFISAVLEWAMAFLAGTAFLFGMAMAWRALRSSIKNGCTHYP